jgi:hypothetical protein
MSDNEIVGEFLVESYENLDGHERDPLSYEPSPHHDEPARFSEVG